MELMGMAMAVGGLLITIVVVGFTALLFWRIFGGLGKANAERDRLLRDGLRARARVTNVQMGGMTMTVGVHRHLQLQIALQVEPDGRPAYAAMLATMVSELQIPQIQPGAVLTVRYDPNDPMKLALEGVGAPQGPLAGALPGSAPAAPGYGVPAAFGAPAAAPMGYAGGPGLAAHGMPGGAVMVPIAGVPRMPTGAKVGLIIGGLSALVGIGVAVVVVAVNVFGVGLGSFSGAGNGSTAESSSGGDVCDRAARCCATIGGPPASCNNFKNIGVPDSACESALTGYDQAAKAQGKQCN